MLQHRSGYTCAYFQVWLTDVACTQYAGAVRKFLFLKVSVYVVNMYTYT